MRIPRRVLVPALALFASLSAHAQYSIANIEIHGAAPYTEAEILSVSGLAPGQLLAHDSLAQADQHLVDTGLFDDAQIGLTGSAKARTVVIELKPFALARLLPASFENFPWWIPDNLTAAIHSRVPLYRGAFPEAGNMQDLVQSALQQILADKGVTATLSHAVVEPTTQHPLRVVNFKIDDPSIRIASVSLLDLSPSTLAALQPLFTRMNGSRYNEGLTGDTIEDRLLQPFRRSGYVTAKLTSPDRSVDPATKGFGVTYTAHIAAGPKYAINTITCVDTPTYSAADCTRDVSEIRAKVTNLDSITLLESKITAAFRVHGYMDAYIDPAPALDDTAHTVSYTLRPIPGEQYRLRTVTALNLDPVAQKEFNSGWLMKPNDIYNETYVAKFINNNTALQHLSTYSASFQASADPNTHLVDLTITFIPGPTTH